MPTLIAQLEAAIARLEAMLAAREHETVRLKAIESAARDALAALDTLLDEAA